MSTAENAKLQYESGQTATAMTALSDSGDGTTFSSGAAPWSSRTGFEFDVKPNGLATGGVVSVAVSASNDVVDVAALSCYLAGVSVSVSASADEAVTRGSTQDNLINSITVTSAGAIAVVAGTEGATMVETRGAAGGPPYIPVGDIEIAQVRLTSQVAAPVTAAEIFAVTGLHKEHYQSPIWTVNALTGEVTFASALPSIHTGDLPKKVYASYATPIFADVPKATDYVPPENSHSVSSTQIYGTTLGSTSTSLNAGSFIAYLDDGVTDSILGEEGENLWFKFFPSRYKAAYNLAQGKLGVTRSYPPSGEISAACTISAASASSNHAS